MSRTRTRGTVFVIKCIHKSSVRQFHRLPIAYQGRQKLAWQKLTAGIVFGNSTRLWWWTWRCICCNWCHSKFFGQLVEFATFDFLSNCNNSSVVTRTDLLVIKEIGDISKYFFRFTITFRATWFQRDMHSFTFATILIFLNLKVRILSGFSWTHAIYL